ncbi:glycosyltransferase family protein [Patiriisocius hiemis]|uniref:Glycosyltransferase n=1 Tax=Patiriisocius hiemis TaxID=3075604 RepID=A0ABU2YEV7_9FLAO|nr:glycosyltransferase [Constantimarinum sp. W242]MDT0556717.1 glycosyltransferase [Constantimarinum sp. W242]
MKILLVGEYSRLHNSLKEGLTALGHEVLLISSGDFFKDYPSDIKLKRKFDSGIQKKLKTLLYKFTGVNITSLSLKNQFFKHTERLTGFDIVQLINESSFAATPKYEKEFIDFLHLNNKKLFLLSCGTDYVSVAFGLSNKLEYSIFKGYLDNTVSKETYFSSLKYLAPAYKELHNYVYSKIEGVIATDMDYHLPLENHPKYLGLIPNPVNIDKIKTPKTQEPTHKIKIFLGINRSNYHTKGIVYFEEALEIIQKKYADKVEVVVVENLPYKEYITKFDKAHILLDQALAYDQGYNALEAMAKGKVVFTGASPQFEAFHNLKNQVAIHTRPDTQEIVANLELLIKNPEKITEISKNAINFIEKEHHYITIAQKYIDIYTT